MQGCIICQKSKAPYTCGICQSSICKSCAIFNEDGNFAFMTRVPAELAHEVYCGPCFDRVVAPELDSYKQLVRRAKNVNVFFQDQGKETRLIKRKEPAVRVDDCPDREELILRLAFLAAQAGYDTLVDVEIVAKKVRNEGYQNRVYSGSGIPAKR